MQRRLVVGEEAAGKKAALFKVANQSAACCALRSCALVLTASEQSKISPRTQRVAQEEWEEGRKEACRYQAARGGTNEKQEIKGVRWRPRQANDD